MTCEPNGLSHTGWFNNAPARSKPSGAQVTNLCSAEARGLCRSVVAGEMSQLRRGELGQGGCQSLDLLGDVAQPLQVRCRIAIFVGDDGQTFAQGSD